MPLYRGSVAHVREKAEHGSLVAELSRSFRERIGYSASVSEQRAWERSLPVLLDDLAEAGLGGIEVLVEHQLPLTSKRADVVLCGRDPSHNGDTFLVVELKQWSSAYLLSDSVDICVLDGFGERLHPVEQVRRYCHHIEDFVDLGRDRPAKVAGAAYLHNATDADVGELWLMPQDQHAQMFTGQRRKEFVRYLRKMLAEGAGSDAANRFLDAPVRPSRQLLALAAEEIQQREQFLLLDEQQVAYSNVMRAVGESHRSGSKQVIIISGGPGSGKSVIALSLLGALARDGRTVLHATGSSAFTQTLRRVAGARSPRVKGMFRYFNQFVDAQQNGLDVLICDEAHRLRETSANRYTSAAFRTGRPQVMELIDAARVPVFLLDEHQVVRPSEIGTVDEIGAAAQALGLGVKLISLDGQFRCGGSRAYETWVLRLLGLQTGGPAPWTGDPVFQLSVSNGPSEMEVRLRHLLADGYGARIAAGYCWTWSDPVSGGGLRPDVRIGPWHRPWNNKKQTSHGGAPGTPFWASDPAGFEQVGCVYTAQGFEYDYAGVIIGPDLVWRGDRWVARPEHSHDSQVKRGTAEQFDRSVRNTYKVLLTRGMRGAMIMSTDRETQAMLESLVG